MNGSDIEDLSAKNGKLIIEKTGHYGNIIASGKLIADTSFSANILRVNGKMSASSDIEAKEVSIIGKAEINGDFIADHVNIEGKIEVNNKFIVHSSARVTGKVEISESLSGDSEATEFNLTGKLESPSITNFNSISIIGAVETENIKQVKNLKINGEINAEDVSVSEITINLSGESQISKLYADKVEIGRNINNIGRKNVSVFGFNFNFKSNSGFIEIDEIHCTGIVELDHVNVNKVYAKELYAGEETEIGEFIEIVEKES